MPNGTLARVRTVALVLSLALLAARTPSRAVAGEGVETAGTVLQYMLPFTAAGIVLAHKDWTRIIGDDGMFQSVRRAGFARKRSPSSVSVCGEAVPAAQSAVQARRLHHKTETQSRTADSGRTADRR